MRDEKHEIDSKKEEGQEEKEETDLSSLIQRAQMNPTDLVHWLKQKLHAPGWKRLPVLERPPEMYFHCNSQLGFTSEETLRTQMWRMWCIHENLADCLTRNGYQRKHEDIQQHVKKEEKEEPAPKRKKAKITRPIAVAVPSTWEELWCLVRDSLSSMSLESLFRWGLESVWTRTIQSKWEHLGESNHLGPCRVLYFDTSEGGGLEDFRKRIVTEHTKHKFKNFLVIISGKPQWSIRKTVKIVNWAHELGFKGLDFSIRLFRDVELMIDRFHAHAVPKHTPWDLDSVQSFLQQMHVRPKHERNVLPILSTHDIMARLLDLKPGGHCEVEFNYPNQTVLDIRLVEDVAARIHNPSPKPHAK